MGNTGGKREGKDGLPMSPSKETPTFDFDPRSRRNKLFQQLSLEDGEYQSSSFKDFSSKPGYSRPRASTIVEQPVVNLKALPTVFHWNGGGKNVFLSGSFNQWKSKIPMSKSTGDFVAIVELPEGKHEYKFHVDGQWVHDPNQPTVNSNGGTLNNLINVMKSDFEVFEALAIDSINSSNTANQNIMKGESSSPPGDYSQEIPKRISPEKSGGPPILPPHLLQVMLNKDTGLQYDPSLLPEPNHVMLNHLYALSIKDGVMVLSATHRYRKKYVTTVMYKPI
ncbi:5'-AMP-activated protein kinase subunit beta-2-like [Anneissia japonica]|uniref:5'-AMP-activated protein kinase subunit beta-2-like n=1 Tax=Anneissia japonica TaxID=1529436 RepID=UPI0014255977|nr:5'-AMP-activated protein kinase subunit beta-2-like [Anneissia japonica]XP_033115846.1 5'-AMP-activated protein kinase subunit beta-2-like [Anneissia japonica]XP_033115847.1 5'-AMP-activated protein kinase subunit beta-2-like [Anneissia japonica]